MEKIWLITQREYLVEVRKKSFIILTLAMPFLMVALVGIVMLLNLANDEGNNIAVVDESGLFTATFHNDENNHYYFYSKEELQGLRDTISGSKYLSGILHIPEATAEYKNLSNGITFTSNRNIGIALIPKLQNKIEERLQMLNLQKKGISLQDLENAHTEVKISVTQQTKQGVNQTTQMQETIKSTLSAILMYATFMFIMIYGVRVMRSIIEEKNNRVVEIIISSVKPFHLMMGKIMGTTFVALTQFSIWIGTTILLLLIFPGIVETITSNQSNIGEGISTNVQLQNQVQEVIQAIFELNIPLIIGVFFLYFFFGYLFYSAFFAAIGASAENDSDTQQFMWIGILPLMLGVYGSISIFENPDGPVGFWLSMIPLTSPVTMMARITYGVSWWQLILSISLLMASVFLMIWFAAKIYRVGILIYGKKPSFKEWIKWMKY